MEKNPKGIAKELNNFEKSSNSKLQSALSHYLWGMYYIKNDLKKSTDYFSSSLQKFKEIGDKKGQIMGLSALSNIEFMRGDFHKMIKTSLMCIELLDKKKDVYNIANLNNNIASSFLQLYDFEKSKKYYDLALSGYEEVRDTNGIIICNRKMGSIFYNQGKLDLAKKYYENAQELALLTNDLINLSSCYVGLGNLFHDKGDFQNAFTKYSQSVDLIKEMDSKCDLVFSLHGFADASIQLGKYQEAKNALLECLNLFESCDIEYQKPEIYRLLFDVHFKMKEFEVAVNYLSISDSLRLELKFENVRKEAQDFETKYQTVQKDKSLLQKQLEISKKNQLIWIVSIFSALMFFIILIIVYFYRKQRILTEALKDSNHTKDLIFTVIGHDLRSPIASLIVDKSVNDSIQRKANSALEIMDELLVYGKTRTFKVSQLELTSTQLILDELEDENSDQITSKSLQIERIEHADFDLYIPVEEWKIVCRNLFMNAVKYSSIGSEILIEMDSKSIQISNLANDSQSKSTQVGHLIVASICTKFDIDFVYENIVNQVTVKLSKR